MGVTESKNHVNKGMIQLCRRTPVWINPSSLRLTELRAFSCPRYPAPCSIVVSVLELLQSLKPVTTIMCYVLADISYVSGLSLPVYNH